MKEFTTKHMLHRHIKKKKSPFIAHTSATLTSNIFPDQPSITVSVQMCHNISSCVTLMKVRYEIKLERQGRHHEVLDNIKIKHVSTTRYILSPRHQIRQHVSAIL